MKRRLILGLALLALVAGTSQASFFDAFNYPDGGLVANSGGVWQPWEGYGGLDVAVTGGVVNITAGFGGSWPDVETQFTNILSGTPKALFMFDFLIHGSGDNAPQVNLGPDNWGSAYNYVGALNIFFNVDGPGNVNAGVGGGGGGGQIGTVTQDVWHHLDVSILEAGGNAYYSFSIDNVLSATAAWSPLDPARGLNGLELGTYTPDADPNTYVLVDNVFAGVPEPATVSLLALGGLGLLRRRARARRAVRLCGR